MGDPYRILGVQPGASESDIKAAYKKLVKKYHPDRYPDEDMARLANEKMTEINNAYDRIMEERRSGAYYSSYSSSDDYGASSGSYYDSSSKTGSYYDSSSRGGYYDSGSGYGGFDAYRVRDLIGRGDLNGADNILIRVANNERNAEWFYLKGMVSYRRGWFNEAYNYTAQATRMDPGNQEYSAALQQMNRQRSGYMYGNSFAGTSPSVRGVDPCAIMNGLCIADCCCEMCGGDLISCC